MTTERIYFWPRWFSASLSRQEQRRLKPRLIKNLSRANLCLWRALNIYDDFLDGEGRREELPLANNYYRCFLEIYYRLNLKLDFYRLFNKIMADLDAANRREARQSKITIIKGKIILPPQLPHFNDLTSLSHKSLALSLSPLALLSNLGYSADSLKMKATLNFFHSALAAKQLSDDAADWLDDLKNGAITAANVLVLQAARKRRLVLDLKRRPEIVHLLFATEAAEKLSEQIRALCRRAKIEAAKLGLNAHSRLVKELILPLEKAVAETAHFRKLML